MKKLLFTILTISILFLASCSPQVVRVSYLDNPNKYRDIEICGDFITEGTFMYMKSKNGVPMTIDLQIYAVNKTKNNVDKEKFFQRKP